MDVKLSTTSVIDEEKPTTKGELKLKDLPPIEELTISVPESKLVKVGRIVSIVDVLVVVESIKSMPPLDIDCILFRSDGSPLGQIFDVFGSIKEPHYSVRFNSADQISTRGIELEMPVYFLPQPDRSITRFAFLDEIRKNKGTDASCENDNEAPDDGDSDC